ncbi:hypothetical protein GCM10009547_10740 [Sporichthya brevicatena]|uniref:Uncharacterized protein n=1 Tax=Sporichthya brevicatena TaxID=171442 RepID=A0ABN1GFR2_9ACTN
MNRPIPPGLTGRQIAGYSLVLPPGWARLPLRSGTDDAIQRVLDESFRGHARDEAAPARRELQQRLREMADAARERSGLDLYLPTGPVHGVVVAASFIVSQVAFDTVSDTPDPEHVVSLLVADARASAAVTVDGAAGARSVTIEPPQAEALDFGARRVDYVLPVPGDASQWIVVTFSTVGQGDPADELADLLVELFDAIMSTFRWTTSSS